MLIIPYKSLSGKRSVEVDMLPIFALLLPNSGLLMGSKGRWGSCLGHDSLDDSHVADDCHISHQSHIWGAHSSVISSLDLLFLL